MPSKHAPIILFVYNRPWHTRQTVEALRRNGGASDSPLFVYADGPKRCQDADSVCQVREYVRGIEGFRSVTVVERERNAGLAGSIIEGVSEIVARFGRVIVVEDDLVTSPHFLSYMNQALELYRDVEEVISIHGYVYPLTAPLPETFFLKGADCWGWATWERGWRQFEADGDKLLNALRSRGLDRRFNFNGGFPYTRMLRDQIAGRNDSWAVRWYASALLNDKLTLYPGRSLVQNIGNDGSGTHCDSTPRFHAEPASRPVILEPLAPREDDRVLRLFEMYFKKSRAPFHQRLVQWLRAWVRHGG